MKKLLSYLITLIVGLIGGIYCHDKVRDTVVNGMNEYFEKKSRERNLKKVSSYTTRPLSYEEELRDYNDISFRTRQDAERILAKMIAEINKYGTVTVHNLLAYAGFKTCWQDGQFGWTDLSDATIYRGQNGRFYLDLPEPFPFDDQED